jgi:hypothetical protein
MNAVSACGVCHKAFAIDENRHAFGDKTICSSCLIEQAEFGHICPACKGVLDADKEEVGLVLTKSDAPHRKLLNEPTAMLIVCPNCRVLFFDLFQYEVLRGFKEAGARLAVK